MHAEKKKRMTGTKFGLLLLIMPVLLLTGCPDVQTGEVPRWGIFEQEVISAKVYADPFRDVELLVTVKRPDGSEFGQYGFFDGGSTWKIRIMPDMEGTWQYNAVFTDNSRRLKGDFVCVKGTKTGPLTVSSENPVWPVFAGSKPVNIRCFHTGDRFFASNFSAGDRKIFLDWIEKHEYNMLSAGSHYLNRKQSGRGKGWDTPALWPLNTEEYDRMEKILSDLEKRNIYVHPFAGFFGRAAEWPVDHSDQEHYIRYTLARLSAFRNIILNVSGPEPLLKPEEYQEGSMTREDINRVARLIEKYDPYNHMLSVHNRTTNERGEPERDPFIFEEWEDYSTLQGGKSTNLNNIYDFIMESRKVVKPVFAHEVMWHGNMYHENLNLENLRKKAITLLMSGSFINFGDMNGNSSSGFSGCLHPDSANSEAHRVLGIVWDIFDDIPFTVLSPRPDLTEGAFCLSDGKHRHLVYSPEGKPFVVNFNYGTGMWINPTTNQKKKMIFTEDKITPPDTTDWLLWVDSKKF
jgi:hypothetical protein